MTHRIVPILGTSPKPPRPVLLLAAATILCLFAGGEPLWAQSASPSEPPAASDELVEKLRRYFAEESEDGRAKIVSEVAANSIQLDRALERLILRPLPDPGTYQHAVPLDNGEPGTVWVDVPPKGQQGKLPVLFGIHSTKASAASERRRWAHTALGRGYLVACPEGPPSWKGRGWGSTVQERRLHLEALRLVQSLYPVDPDRIFAVGISRGGHAVWEFLLQYPAFWAGGYSQAGGPRLVNLPFLPNLGNTGLMAVIGQDDQPALLRNVRFAIRSAGPRKGDVVYDELSGVGHEYVPGRDQHFLEWAAQRRRQKHPSQLSLYLCRPDQGKLHWIEVEELEPGLVDPATEKPTMTGRGDGVKSEDERLQHVAVEARKKMAWLHAVVARNEFRISATKIRRLRVLLSDRLVNFSQPVRVIINGRVMHEGVVPGFADHLLEDCRVNQDLSRRFWASLRFEVP